MPAIEFQPDKKCRILSGHIWPKKSLISVNYGQNPQNFRLRRRLPEKLQITSFMMAFSMELEKISTKNNKKKIETEFRYTTQSSGGYSDP